MIILRKYARWFLIGYSFTRTLISNPINESLHAMCNVYITVTSTFIKTNYSISSTLSEIFRYYDEKLQKAKREILSKGEQYLLNADIEKLVDYYSKKDNLPLVEKDERREIDYEHESSPTPSGILKLTIWYPRIPYDNITEVLNRKSTTYFPSKYLLNYQKGCITSQVEIRIEGEGQENRINREIQLIEEIIDQKNSDVNFNNDKYSRQLTQFLTQYQEKIKRNTALIDGIIKKIPYKIRRKSNVKAEPLNITVRKSIEPIYPKIEQPSEPYLEAEKVDAIVEIIKNAGKGFEVTPHVFCLLYEEQLRDIILGFLNAIFILGATGESFVKQRHTDIHIIVEKGSLLTAECKKWDGPRLYGKTIDQLFQYLTWRQNYGIIITFSTRTNFSKVIQKAITSTVKHNTIQNSEIREIEPGHFVTNHKFPEDEAKRVIIHHLLFNLYSIN
ncbi:MAG: hypothetical protein ACXACP_09975 [Candidatus Hodarchaeales archaeon]|jgi:hypothetical protein